MNEKNQYRITKDVVVTNNKVFGGKNEQFNLKNKLNLVPPMCKQRKKGF